MPTIRPNKNYGDTKAIDALIRQASGMKQGAGDNVPTPRIPVGRPPGSTATPQVAPILQSGGTEPQPDLPPEHVEIMRNAGRAMRVAQIGQQFASDPLYGPWLQEYARRAAADAEERARDVRNLTPNFSV